MDRLQPAVQTYSILAVALAAGANLSTTVITLPALLEAPAKTLAVQWKILFDTGITPVVSLSMTAAVGFATLAYRSSLAPHLSPSIGLGHSKRNLFIAASATAFGLAPYTRLLMWQNIATLEARATAAGQGQTMHDTHQLVRTWGTLNFWRGMMLLTSAGLGVWASVK